MEGIVSYIVSAIQCRVLVSRLFDNVKYKVLLTWKVMHFKVMEIVE